MTKWQRKNDNCKNYLLCKKVKFYALKDEDIFFEWIEKIDCIKSIDAAKDELYLDLVDRSLTFDDVNDLICLFVRYGIDLKQLAKYKTVDNEEAFRPWAKKIFGKEVAVFSCNSKDKD